MPNSIADNLQRLVNAKTAIASAITEKGGTVGVNDGLEEFPAAIATIPSGGGGGGATRNAVNFYDYDGTLLHSYTKSEFAALQSMPENPTHEGLTAQGWNWSLSDAKTYVDTYDYLDIGQMYITSDGKTRLYITLSEGRTSPVLCLYLEVDTEVDVDWGDGTSSTFSSTSAGYKQERHEYASAGDYAIAISVLSGSIALRSNYPSYSSLLSNGSNSGSSPDVGYRNAIKQISIGSSVGSNIFQNVFYGCYSLTSITLPSGITSIGISAFNNCYSLTSITLPSGITSIGNTAFNNCYSLTSITLPSGIMSIGDSAFYGCGSLTSITLPSSVTSISASAFYGCGSLASITLPNSVTSIGTNAFYGCYSLTSITLPSGIMSIGDSVFNCCHSLTSITLPSSITSISSNVFNSCYSITSITLPSSITSISSGAFNNCYSLTSITLPSGITSISSSAFSNCYSLTSITLPSGVTSISGNAFYGCYSLTSITLPSGVTSIGDGAFNSCYSLTSITLPSSVTSISASAFNNCYSLASITLPSSVTSIGYSAFNNCRSLSSITLPSSVTSIGNNAFKGCYSLAVITIKKSEGAITGSPWGASTSSPTSTQIVWDSDHYGFKIDKTNDNSENAVIYTHDAVTMTPAYMDFTNDQFDYGSWGNAFFVRDCYPVALNLDGTIAYRLDPDDYTKKTDGTASDIFYELLSTAPSDWNTQWKQYYTKSGDEYILNDQVSAPTFAQDTYYKLTYNSSFTGNFMMAFPKVWFYRHEDSQYNYIEISNYKLSDDWKCYAHINASGQEVDFIYLPLFKGVIVNSKLRSLPGQIPQGGTTATDEVNAATALGSRWQIWDHSSVECLNDLLTLMSKSIDSQGRFGQGRSTGYDPADTVTYGKLQTGTLIKKGKFRGYSVTTKEVKVFGLEGFWANRFDRLQGMLLMNNVWKIKMTPPYNFTGTDFVTLSTAEVPSGTGFLSRVQTSEYGSIPASIANGSGTKYFKDPFFKSATGTCVAVRGGSCTDGGNAGFRYINVDSAASVSYWPIGASPVYK